MIRSHQNTSSHGRPFPQVLLEEWVEYRYSSNTTSFIISKAKVAPLKQLMLPRLELMGATVAVELFNVITSSIQCQVDSVHMWSDSQIVLHWLNSDKKLKQFISNRVTAVIKICPAQWWGYCPSADNPADLLTRGISLSYLQTSKPWAHEPEWIIHKELKPTWSPTDILLVQLTVAEAEVLPPDPRNDSSDVDKNPTIANIIDIERYSKLSKLLYVTVYVLRFIECVKTRESKPTGQLQPMNSIRHK